MPEIGVDPCFKVKVDLVTVNGSIASLKVAPTLVLTGTLVAPSALMVPVTTGASVSGPSPVVKFHAKSTASALPARSLTPVVIVALYGVLGARWLAGTNTALTLEYFTVPDTGVSPCFRVKVTVKTVNGFIASLKTAVIALLMGTPVSALAGMVELTVGAVVSGPVFAAGAMQADIQVTASTMMMDIPSRNTGFLFIRNSLSICHQEDRDLQG